MRVGLDAKYLVQNAKLEAMKALEVAHKQGFEGLLFRSILELSPNLDPGKLKEVRAYADELGMYLEVGVGRVNPYNIPLNPQVRALGNGDYMLGMTLMIQAAHSIGCTELWGECAGYMYGLTGLYAIDRFRTDVSWEDQLAATHKFLLKLAPILKEHGCRINLETHEEITSFELLHLIDQIGPDLLGITYDTGNMILRGEDPIATATRVAPYTHMTHIKDMVLCLNIEGLYYHLCSCGQGVINWEIVLPILYKENPDLTLSIEDGRSSHIIPIFNPIWQSMHPDLSISEMVSLLHLAKVSENQVKSGEKPDPAISTSKIPEEELRISRIQTTVSHLRSIIQDKCIGGR
jgi:sugar phosphate isomerase/epimerase